MSLNSSDDADNASGSTSRASKLSYDARYIHRLQKASMQLNASEDSFFLNKAPFLVKLDKRSISLSIDVVATTEALYHFRPNHRITMDNLVWTLRLAPFGTGGRQYMVELKVSSENEDDTDWQAEVLIKTTAGGTLLMCPNKKNHPINFTAKAHAVVLLVLDPATVQAWSNGLIQVDIYPQSSNGIFRGPLYSSPNSASDVAINVHSSSNGVRRTFYVNRHWISHESDAFHRFFNYEPELREVTVTDVNPREFLILLRAIDRSDDYELFNPLKIETILRMANKFEMHYLLEYIGPRLIQCDTLCEMGKLRLADSYLPWPFVLDILARCDLAYLRDSPAYDTISYKLRSEICNQLSPRKSSRNYRS